MSQAKLFFAITGSLLLISLAFLLFGWWVLIPALGGVIWQVAGHLTLPRRPKPSRPHPAHVASVASKPASTVTWQETVEAIERARPVPTNAPEIGPTFQLPQKPTWQATVEAVEAARRGDAEPIPPCSLTGHHGSPVAPPAGLDAGQVLATASWAHIDGAELVRRIDDIRASVNGGNPRDTNSLVRDCCPAKAWDWPEAKAFLERTGQRGTRLQLVEIIAHRLTRLHYLSARITQMRASANHRPYWVLQPVNDPLTPPACVEAAKVAKRHDHEIWANGGPLHCDHIYCRCAVRAFTEDELQKRHIAIDRS